MTHVMDDEVHTYYRRIQERQEWHRMSRLFLENNKITLLFVIWIWM